MPGKNNYSIYNVFLNVTEAYMAKKDPLMIGIGFLPRSL